jgi:cysteinyl-tRNA synthetase
MVCDATMASRGIPEPHRGSRHDMSNLKIYNTLAREKQPFVPLVAGKAGMYVCGMTIYDYCHVGHARMLMAFDVVYRWLRASGYEVTYVRNITDIEDKIIKRAVENGETISALTTRFLNYMNEDAGALGILRPTVEPRATDYVPQMLATIAQLEEKGLAYQATDGDVNYAVRSFPGYGKLSGRSLDELRAGERVEVNTGKRDPLDFVLWKSSKAEEPADTKWASKWGTGRPGWHIECTAMSCATLGNHFDIHGGGEDLQFPHHENEIAQSEGAHGGTFVNYWLHNGFLQLDNEKMSKSLGNFFTIRDVLKKFDAEVVRFFILRAHYRSPLNYSEAILEDAKNGLNRLYTALKEHCPAVAADQHVLAADLLAGGEGREYAQRFIDAMDDDFNTPVAIAVLFDLAGEVNRTRSAALAAMLCRLGATIGLLQRTPQEYLQGGAPGGLSEEQVAAGIVARRNAKQSKNFAEADRIRAELLAQGIVLEDKPDGTTEWRRA